MDKNEAIVAFLRDCPAIQENPLFFNFADEEDGSNHIITQSDQTKHHYVDGSLLRTYTFTIACYKSVSHFAVTDGTASSDENIENMALVQEILDWINEQSDLHNYPDFGEGYVVEEMETLTDDPKVDGIDTSVNPPLARYSFKIRIEYLDNTKKLWNS